MKNLKPQKAFHLLRLFLLKLGSPSFSKPIFQKTLIPIRVKR